MFVVTAIEELLVATFRSLQTHETVRLSVAISTCPTTRIPNSKVILVVILRVASDRIVILVYRRTRRFIAATTQWLLPPATILRQLYSLTHIPAPNSSERLPGVQPIALRYLLPM